MTAATSFAQTLARPGLVGSGLNSDPWWKSSVFFDIVALSGDYPDFKAIAARLDALQGLGIDALIVPTPHLPSELVHTQAAGSSSGSGTAVANGTPDSAIDDFDELVHEASRRNIRVLLNIAPYDPNGEAFVLSAAARFWLSHGIAGFRLISPAGASAQDSQTMLQQLRTLTSSAIGQRIVISSFDPSQASDAPMASPASRHAAVARVAPGASTDHGQLQIDSRIGASAPEAVRLRPLIADTLGQPNLVLDVHGAVAKPVAGAPTEPLAAKGLAAILLTTHAAGMIDSQQLPGLPATPSPATPAATTARPAVNLGSQAVRPAAAVSRAPTLLQWYHELVSLHHGNPAVRNGSITFLDFDSQNALVYVIQPVQGGRIQSGPLNPPLVFVCNLSGKPLQLSLMDALKSLSLRGSFLRTVLRTDDGMGAQDLSSVAVPAYGVYIGELKR
jgi:alpha-glucosidase